MLIYGAKLNRIHTDWKVTEHRLTASEGKFSNAFNYSGIGFAIVATNGAWLDVNPALSAMLGYTRGEFLKLTFQEITYPEDLAADLNLLYKTMSGEIDNYQMEKRYIHKDGRIIWGKLAVSIVRQGNEPKYFVSQIVDITDLKKNGQYQ